MNKNELEQLVSLYSQGEIDKEQHETLSEELRTNPDSRKLFRELIDLEVALSTWATESLESEFVVPSINADQHSEPNHRSRWIGIMSLVASLLVIAIGWGLYQRSQENPEFARQGDGDREAEFGQITSVSFGSIKQTNCTWKANPFETSGGVFNEGKLDLTSGIAQLNFSSGTCLTLEGPCELEVTSVASAKLLGGNVVVNVSEISDGFLLTTPDAEIIDQGTEYGVSLDETATEIHVFDGRVLWQPNGDDEARDSKIKAISAGEASRFARNDPINAKRIPFGQRKFVRAMEAQIQASARGKLIAFDGFENLAGKVRRGRSGFGWGTGWQPPGRRKNVGTIIDAPNDEVFGFNRRGQRLLKLSSGAIIQRELEEPLFSKKRTVFYVSLILRRCVDASVDDSSFELAIKPVETGRRSRRIENGIGFGLTSESSPFVKNEGVINEAAVRLPNKVLFCVAKFSSLENSRSRVQLRLFQSEDRIDQFEPETWTAESSTSLSSSADSTRVTLSSAANGDWEIDQLRIGETWASVVESDRKSQTETKENGE